MRSRPRPGAGLATVHRPIRAPGARNRAIDRLRRDRTLTEKTRLLELEAKREPPSMSTHFSFPDERWS
jgi:hypothetical protein